MHCLHWNVIVDRAYLTMYTVAFTTSWVVTGVDRAYLTMYTVAFTTSWVVTGVDRAYLTM